MALSHEEDGSMARKRHRPEEIVAKLRQVEGLPAQGQAVAEAIRSIGVTEVSSGTSCSTARFSPRSRRPRSSSRAGVATITPFAHTPRWPTGCPHPRFSSGRLRFPNQLRRPPRPWRSGLSCTNIRPGPLHGGRPGAPNHPQTQGKIERWHQTLKNRILLETDDLPGDLEAQVSAFVEPYNRQRYYESLNTLTPADVYFGRGPAILLERDRIKRQTILHRRLQHHTQAA